MGRGITTTGTLIARNSESIMENRPIDGLGRWNQSLFKTPAACRTSSAVDGQTREISRSSGSRWNSMTTSSRTWGGGSANANNSNINADPRRRSRRRRAPIRRVCGAWRVLIDDRRLLGADLLSRCRWPPSCSASTWRGNPRSCSIARTPAPAPTSPAT